MRVNIRASQEQKDLVTLQSDTLVQQLRAMTPAQAAQWVETNVTNLVEARAVLKLFARILCVLARRL